MAKYAFLNTPAHGHVIPTLPLVKELVSRGEQVIYYLDEEFKCAIEATGAIFYSYKKTEQVNPDEDMLNTLLESLRLEQPDYIVYDFMCFVGGLIAEVLQIPAVTVRATYAQNKYFNLRTIHQHNSTIWTATANEASASLVIQTQIAKICKILHLSTEKIPWYHNPLDVFAYGEKLNICAIPRLLQPVAHTFDERYLFTGSSIMPRLPEGNFPFDKLDGRSLLYISLGTIFNQRTDIFKACIKAFGNTDWQVVLSRGQKPISNVLGPIPKNILVSNYVPQLEVLPRSSIFISHAGMNSVIESLYYGVPLVLIPQIAEQAITAERVQALGLGIALNPDTITVEILRNAVEQITNDHQFYERVQAMRQTILREGGPQRAADALMRLNKR